MRFIFPNVLTIEEIDEVLYKIRRELMCLAHEMRDSANLTIFLSEKLGREISFISTDFICTKEYVGIKRTLFGHNVEFFYSDKYEAYIGIKVSEIDKEESDA